MPGTPHLAFAAAALALALSGCSSGPNLARLNPATWFGAGEAEEAAEPEATPEVAPPADGRPSAALLSRARLEPTRFGAILRVEGQIAWPALVLPALRAEDGGRPDADGVLRFTMVAERTSSRDKLFSLNELVFGEERGEDVVNSEMRSVIAATFISERVLRDAVAVTVTAQEGEIRIPLR